MNIVEECERRLSGGEESERIYAAEDAAESNDPGCLDILLRRLPVEPSRAVRGAIFGALRVMDGDAVVAAAIELLASPDAYLRNEAVELLRSKGRAVIPALVQAFPAGGSSERKLILDAMTSLDGPAAAALYQLALADADRNVVITAVENIGRAGRAEFRPELERLFDPAEIMLAAACLEALAEVGDARTVAVVAARLPQDAPVPLVLRDAYARLLGAHGGGEAGATLQALLAGAGGHLRERILAAQELWRRRHPEPCAPGESNSEGGKSGLICSASGTGDRNYESREGDSA